MTTNSLLTHIGRLLFFLALQIILFRSLVLFNVAFCFIYIGAIITLPKEISHSYLILVSFLSGLLVDAFYNTMGMHAAASTLIGYLRPYILLLITPQRGYEDKSDFNIQTMGFIWFITFVGILALIHHFFIFFLELGSFTLFFTTLLKVVCSFLFTMFMIIIFQFLRNK
jgi:hypothetical protein